METPNVKHAGSAFFKVPSKLPRRCDSAVVTPIKNVIPAQGGNDILASALNVLQHDASMKSSKIPNVSPQLGGKRIFVCHAEATTSQQFSDEQSNSKM